MADVTPLSGAEQTQIARALIVWLNTFPSKPVTKLSFQNLPKTGPGMSMGGLAGAVKTGEYVDGSYDAQYPFSIVYRITPSSDNDRMNAQSLLDSFGEWMESQANFPNLGTKKTATEIIRTSTPGLVYRDDAGNEDYQGLFVLNYEQEGN